MRSLSPTLFLLASAVAVAAAAEPSKPAPVPWTGEADAGTDVTAVDDRLWTQAASRRRQRLATAPQPIEVIEADESVASPATTIPDRLRYVAGIDVIQERHGQYDVGLRGYNGVGNNRLLVLADGVDLRWDGIGSTQWIGALHPSDVERIEVAKGPSSVTYGANAFSGAILISDRRVGQRPELYTVTGAGDAGYVDVDGTALAPLGSRFYLKASAGQTYRNDLPATHGTTTYTPNRRTASSGDADVRSERWGGLAGWHVAPTVDLEAGYHDVHFDEWEVVDDYDVGSNHTDWDFHTADARLRTPWGELRHVHQWADYFYSNQKAFYAFPDFRYAQAGFHDVRDTTRGQLNLTLPDHALTMGAEYLRTSSESNLWKANGKALDEDTWDSVTTTNTAVFAEDQYAFAPAWTLTGGVRVDDHSRVGINTSPRAAVNFVPSEDEYWLLSISRGYRLPNFIESYIQSYFFASDPSLDAETITAVELGWNRRIDDGALVVGVNGFFNRSQDQIWILPLPAATMQANYNAWLGTGPDFTKQPGPFFQFQNLDNPATVLGTEASARMKIGESPFTLWGNGSYTYFRFDHPIRYQSTGINDFANVFPGTDFRFDETLGRDVNGPPPWRANLGVDLAWGRLFGTAVGRFVDGRTVFSFANNTPSAGQVTTQHVDSYTAFDLSIGIDCGAGDRTRYAKLAVLDVFDSSHGEWWHASSAELVNGREDQLTSDIGRLMTFELGWLF
jgi:outer membrane receptor for ferrienterochelin and colicin